MFHIGIACYPQIVQFLFVQGSLSQSWLLDSSTFFYVELEPERSASAGGKTTSFFATLSLSMVPGFTLGEQNNAEAFS